MITDHPYYRTFSASLRTAQERIWDSVIDAVEKDHARLKSAFLGTGAEAPAAGSLRLNPDLVIPDYHATVDIHLQPGGYHTEQDADDIAAGAIYDRAVFLYANGRFGNQTQLMGETLVEALRVALPDFRPARILEIGCTVGNSITPYTAAFPEAEIQAIDVAAPCLRYAHARAEALGAAIHFSQHNAEKTDFADSSFDLIVSHIFFHETSRTAVDNILAECHRLLKPGGFFVSSTVCLADRLWFLRPVIPVMQWLGKAPYVSFLRAADMLREVASAGFEEQEHWTHGRTNSLFLVARKADSP